MKFTQFPAHNNYIFEEITNVQQKGFIGVKESLVEMHITGVAMLGRQEGGGDLSEAESLQN